MNKLCDKSDCTACFACVNACPKNCIHMTEDKSGAIYPEIDGSICIDCKMCTRSCPSINRVAFATPQKVYAAYSKDEETHILSTSGGVCYEICKNFLNDGAVYACAVNDDLSLSFIKCKTVDDLNKTRGSKYFHAHIGDTFKKIKTDLTNGENILFVGTPWQVTGLKFFLGREYENLFTIDIVCHGAPDEAVFKAYSRFELKGDFEKAKFVSFRDKNEYIIKYFDENGCIIKQIPQRQSYYLTAFLDGVCQRENCYTCKYAQPQRVGDISLGDFWGLGDEIPFEYKTNNGTNVVLQNTKKGENLLCRVKRNINLYERTLDEALKKNGQLNKPLYKNENAKKYAALAENGDIAAALIKYNTKKRALTFLRRKIYKSKKLYRMMKKSSFFKDRI